jgi:hypothetical protein
MLQGNSKTQNIFPCGNIFAPFQTCNVKPGQCGMQATALCSNAGNIYTFR